MIRGLRFAKPGNGQLLLSMAGSALWQRLTGLDLRDSSTTRDGSWHR